MTSKLELSPCSGKSVADTYLLAMRCPVYRKRDSHLGFRTELENLAGDAKGKGTSGENREAESTDAPARGGLPRSSNEGSVMELERRGWVTRATVGEPTGNRRSFLIAAEGGGLHEWHEPYKSRGLRTVL
jgi:hypothetical protein